MAEAAKSVCDYMSNGKGIVCVNVMNRLSVDCDCDSNPAEPDMHDIGILASLDAGSSLRRFGIQSERFGKFD